MPPTVDGPASSAFQPVVLKGNAALAKLGARGVPAKMVEAAGHAPVGACVSFGIPFEIGRVVVVRDKPAATPTPKLKCQWLVFVHACDEHVMRRNESGFVSPMRGRGGLGEHLANYVFVYADGHEERVAIKRRHHMMTAWRGWGENCFEAVAHRKPCPVKPPHEQLGLGWGHRQTRASSGDEGAWVNWLWAWENPRPGKALKEIRFEPVSGTVVVSGVTAGKASSNPLRWRTRRKAVLSLAKGAEFQPDLDGCGSLEQVRLDLGQVISATRRPVYGNDAWADSYNNKLPEVSRSELIVEYASHADARFHLAGNKTVPVAKLESAGKAGKMEVVAPATQRVSFRVIDKETRVPVPVKLHIHGEGGEYLPPVDRHRIPNGAWFEDYSVDFLHANVHLCTYIPGRTSVDLPVGRVYIEVSKGFEIAPVRKVVEVTPATTEIEMELEHVLPWREGGWVSADTHVHFLSPTSALLEGSGEGVNVVNLLASQWGELMTNVGDFDGRTTHGEGEHLVRVGTENRQHVMGHISLLGYGGDIIAPMTTGGPDESALGDPVGILLTEWARQCKNQDGVVVLPHFPNPRLEGAAAIVDGSIDGVEMTCWGSLYGGIDPYTLSDWYRYLNCGYFVAAVGGTDKMSATTAVGAVRTYARVTGEFTYEAWKEAVRLGRTFVTYGPLMEFSIEGRPPGERISLPESGGTVDVVWDVASVTVPMSRVELVVNGEIRESKEVDAKRAAGNWSLKVDRSSWAALLVRGHYDDKPEIIAAHSSPVMVAVDKSPFYAEADALTILEQIEGALAYLDVVGTRAEEAAYKRMRMVLVGAHKRIHTQMHQNGYFHDHNVAQDHEEHH